VDSAWEAIFMLLVLKIPLFYLAAVVWWAIRAEPEPPGDGGRDEALVPLTPCGWDDWKRRRAARVGLRPGRRPLRPAPLLARP
jgi:hypothetical protein